MDGETIGNVSINTSFGIYGDLSNTAKLNVSSNNEIAVAARDEIQEGKAKILLDLENGVRQEFEIEITKIYKNNNPSRSDQHGTYDAARRSCASLQHRYSFRRGRLRVQNHDRPQRRRDHYRGSRRACPCSQRSSRNTQ